MAPQAVANGLIPSMNGHDNNIEKNHAEIHARELFTAGVGGPEHIVPIVHRGSSSSKRKIGYSRIVDNGDNDNGNERNNNNNNNNNNIFDEESGPSASYDTGATGTSTTTLIQKTIMGTSTTGSTGTTNKDNGSYTTTDNETVAFSDNNDDDDDDCNVTTIIDYDDSNVPNRSMCHLFGINSFALAYGAILSTFGLIILPVESENLWPEEHAVLLAIFLGICGISQLSGPIAGYFSDRCTSRLGRRRPFLLFSSIIIIPSLVVMRWSSSTKNLPVYIFCFFCAMLALNVMYVAYSGALTDLVNENQRGFANGLMGAFSVGGASIGFGCFSLFLTVEQGYIFYIMVMAVTVTISMVSWLERPIYDDYTVVGSSTSSSSSSSSWTWKDIGEAYWIDPIEHRDFFLVFVSRTLYYMGVSVQTFMLFYFRDVIHSNNPQADVAFLALFGQLSGAIFCVPMGLLSNRTGRKALIYLSSAIIMGTYFMFMFFRTRQLAFVGGVIYGIGNGTYLSVDYALACDTIPNKDNAARYLGIWGVGAFVGTLFGPMLVGPALLYFGSFSGRVDEHGVPMYDDLGYMVILGIGILCLFAGAVTVAPIRSAK